MKTQVKERKGQRAPAAVKIGMSRQVVIPKRIHDDLGLAPGDYLEVEREGDRVVFTPKTFVERRLAEGLYDVRNGRVHGPFVSPSALIRSLRKTKKPNHS